jgi:hypothetical protein
MQEHRLIERLTTYWNHVRKDAPMPDFAHFNVSAIEDIWQQCILFTVQPAVEGVQPNVNFYRVGENLRSIYGQDMTGRSFNPAHHHFQGATVVRKITELMGNPEPITDMGQFVNSQSKIVKYRSCLLPFGGPDGKITHIVAGLSWREF